MLAKRIIPCLDVDQGRVVKGTNFVQIRDAGDPVLLAKVYDEQHADELIFLDITASAHQREIMIDMVRKVAAEVFIPFTVGGGISDTNIIQQILKAGADKVSINTAAVMNPRLIAESAHLFGNQCIVTAIDSRQISVELANIARTVRIPRELADCAIDAASQYEVYIHGGRTPTGIDVIKWAQRTVALGSGEILLTSMDADGTKAGYDVGVTQAVKSVVSVPVIASGGAGTIEHIAQALHVCDAALLASLLHFRELTIPEIKQALIQQGFVIRP